MSSALAAGAAAASNSASESCLTSWVGALCAIDAAGIVLAVLATGALAAGFRDDGGEATDVPKAAEAANAAGAAATSKTLTELGWLEGSTALSALKYFGFGICVCPECLGALSISLNSWERC